MIAVVSGVELQLVGLLAVIGAALTATAYQANRRHQPEPGSGRIVHVHHWVKDGTPCTTVTVRRWRRLYATTTWHSIDPRTRAYLPHSVVDMPVDRIGDWR